MNIIELLLSLGTLEIAGFRFSAWLIERTMDVGTGKLWGLIRSKVNKDNQSIDCKIYNLIEKSVIECFNEPVKLDEVASICEIIFYSMNKTKKIDRQNIKKEIQHKGVELKNFNTDVWYMNFISNIAKQQELTNYVLIKIFNEMIISHQKNSEETLDYLKSINNGLDSDKGSLMSEEHKRLAKMVKKYSQDGFRWKMEEIDNFCEIFMSNYKYKNVTPDIIELGYWLTDVYERNKRFDKSIEIALIILEHLKEIEDDIDIYTDKGYIQKIIGCAYSLIIPKRALVEKKQLLEQSEKYLIYAENCCRKYCENKRNRMVEQKFLEGLLYSNYGAWYVNKADIEKIQGNIEKATELYKEGIKRHTRSKESRKIELQILQFDENNDKRIKEVKNRIARCISNLGGVYFKMGNYEQAILFQEEALEDFERLGDEERKNLVKSYIVGCYIEMWTQDIDKYNEQDCLKCKKFIEEMKLYYKNNSICSKREEQLKRIIDKLRIEIL